MGWKQTQRIHTTSARTAWDQEIPYSQMYPPNLTVDWLDTDTPENAQYEKDIKYTFNEYGFRSDPFYERSEINALAIGCSMTVGVGVDQHENWPNRFKSKIQEYTGHSVTMWNMATSGASTDYVVRMIYKVVHDLKPDTIAIYWPPLARLELPTPFEGKVTQAAFHMSNLFPKQLVDEDYLIYNYHKNLNFLRHIMRGTRSAILFNTPVEIPLHNQLTGIDETFVANTGARDGQHPDAEWHDRVADWYLNRWINHHNHPLSETLDRIKIQINK